MKFSLSLILLFCVFVGCERSKKKSNQIVSHIETASLSSGDGCGFINQVESKEYFLFNSDNQAKNAMRRIMQLTGLPANFEIKAADVDYAIAVVVKDVDPPKRYVLYNQTFFSNIEKQTGSAFAALSILAHEIGHHLAGHTLSEKGSRPLLELEADRFSGYILRKLNASLADAQAAVNSVCSEIGNDTHPGKRARLAAIANGWKEADEEVDGKMADEKPIKANSDLLKKLEVDYTISMAPVWALAMRNKVLDKKELSIVNSTNLQTKQLLDGETLIAALKPGHPIKLLSSVGKFYKIETDINGVIKYGFIAKNVYGKSTLSKIKEESQFKK